MRVVTIRELRNHGGDVIERVIAGERLTVTRAGEPVAELGPVRRRPARATTLLERWSRLPAVDPEAFRADVDAVIDASL
jgi:prevent-host-death family protein